MRGNAVRKFQKSLEPIDLGPPVHHHRGPVVRSADDREQGKGQHIDKAMAAVVSPGIRHVQKRARNLHCRLGIHTKAPVQEYKVKNKSAKLRVDRGKRSGRTIKAQAQDYDNETTAVQMRSPWSVCASNRNGA